MCQKPEHNNEYCVIGNHRNSLVDFGIKFFCYIFVRFLQAK